MKFYLQIFFIHQVCCDLKLFGLFKGCGLSLSDDYNYHRNTQLFSTQLFKRVAKKYDYHFAVSQYAIWLAMCGIAEGAKEDLKPSLFKALHLPENVCYRHKYYEIATELEDPSSDVTLSRKRLVLLDKKLKINDTWMISVRDAGLLNPLIAPLSDLKSATKMIGNFGPLPEIDAPANALLLDRLDYHGLWTTGFSEDLIEKGDFFDDEGKKIGELEYMKAQMRVKFAIIPFLHAKILELNVGNNGRYRMIFIINMGKHTIKRTIKHFPPTFVLDILPSLMESIIPLELAIPRFSMTSRLDLKETLSELGLAGVFKNGTNTEISDPPAVPFTLIQEVSININSSGLDPPTSAGVLGLATGIASLTGKDFIANRPFIYGLLDSQTRTWLFSGVFSDPKFSEWTSAISSNEVDTYKIDLLKKYENAKKLLNSVTKSLKENQAFDEGETTVAEIH